MRVDGSVLDDFVKQITSKLKAEQEQARITADRDGQAGQVIHAQAPQWWAELRDWVREFCEESNRALDEERFGFELTPTWQLRVAMRAHKGRVHTLEAHFNQELNHIVYCVGNKTGEFTPHYAGDGEIEFTDGRRPSSVDGMGKTFINALLQEENG